MLTENGNIVISKTPAIASEDYELLRNTGINYIQQFSGKIWTDYNIHDPGVTIFELLCYALTDLAYRTSFPVADLLTDPGKKSADAKDFFTARKILTTHPVTINDYRKLILDRIPGVRNIWFDTLDNVNYTPDIYFDQKTVDITLMEPPSDHPYYLLQLKGLYVVKIEAEDYQTIQDHHPNYLITLTKYRDADSLHTETEAQPDEYKECLKNYITKLLLDSRNLCEDFEIIKVADEEFVAVCADIELKPDANADEIFLAINSALYNYINPSLHFYSFKELIDKGKRTEDIFNSPAAVRGFIDDNDLNEHGHKEVLYVSDIINLLMDIPGILQIKKISLSSYKKNDDGTYTILQNAQQYCLHLQDTINSVFQFMLDAAENDTTKIFNHIRFSKGLIYFPPKRKAAYSNYSFIDYPNLPKNFENDLPVPPGQNRNLLNYYSVQNDFPMFYYTGMNGIPNSETTLRKAQRLQSKAYLLFFDQLLADYLAQLNNLKKVFTFKGGVHAPVMQPFALTQNQIKDLRMLLASDHDIEENISDEDFFATTYNTYSGLLETSVQQKQRRNRLLDHLLARFNEVFVDYSVFKFQQNTSGDFFNEVPTETLINDKIQFLKLYPVISSRRSHAFNYTKNVYDIDNTSGLQLRVQKMLGVTSAQNKKLVTPLNSINYKDLLNDIANDNPPLNKLQVKDNRFDSFEANFGIHVLEHILLRPLYNQSTDELTQLLPLCGDGTNNQQADCLLPDNYSMHLTVVAPGWLAISNNMDFRAFTENLIRTEAPAHAAIKICWLDPSLMFLFEETTEVFFNAMAKIKQPGAKPSNTDFTDFNTALNDVYTMMRLLKNSYLPSILNECENINYNAETDKIKVPVILNYSALGSDDADEWYAFTNPDTLSQPTIITEEKKKAADKPAVSLETTKPTSEPKKAVDKTELVSESKADTKKEKSITNPVSITKELKPATEKKEPVLKSMHNSGKIKTAVKKAVEEKKQQTKSIQEKKPVKQSKKVIERNPAGETKKVEKKSSKKIIEKKKEPVKKYPKKKN